MSSADGQRLVVERDGPVVRVWLARPEKRNALDTPTLEELVALYRSFDTDFEVRVVVLGGQGPAFSAGADRTAPPGSEHMARSGGAPATQALRSPIWRTSSSRARSSAIPRVACAGAPVT